MLIRCRGFDRGRGTKVLSGVRNMISQSLSSSSSSKVFFESIPCLPKSENEVNKIIYQSLSATPDSIHGRPSHKLFYCIYFHERLHSSMATPPTRCPFFMSLQLRFFKNYMAQRMFRTWRRAARAQHFEKIQKKLQVSPRAWGSCLVVE